VLFNVATFLVFSMLRDLFAFAVNELKRPNCPLCKGACEFITRREWDQGGTLQETVVVVGKLESDTGARHSRTVVMVSILVTLLIH
jgi:hypothetical protein